MTHTIAVMLYVRELHDTLFSHDLIYFSDTMKHIKVDSIFEMGLPLHTMPVVSDGTDYCLRQDSV